MTIKKLSKACSGLLLLATCGTTAAGQDAYIGEIMLVGYNFCPRGSAEANGQILAISQNQALFSLYGCNYGGDCRTTFALPDLRGRAPIGAGSGPGLPNYPLGAKTGTASATLNINQMPAHTHTAETTVTVESSLQASSTAANTTTPTGNVLAMSRSNAYLQTSPDVTLASDAIATQSSASTVVSNTGGSQAFSIQNPVQALRYCVVLQGIFPSRN